MSVGKLAVIAIVLLLMAGLVIVGCEGDTGPQGPGGLPGDEGDPGQDRPVAPAADRSFGIMITNSTETDFNGASLVELTFNAGATPSATKVAAVELSKAPTIDGIDGGAAEWGSAPVATVTLANISGSDNGISEARIRAGYDSDYFYMQVSWREDSNTGFAVAADITKNQWVNDLESGDWLQRGGEDKLYLTWEISGFTTWDSQGLDAIFDGSDFATSGQGEAADLWVWQSTETNYSGYLADMVVTQTGLALDLGSGFVMENIEGTLPKYMASNSPESGSSYPLRSFEFTAFDSTIDWEKDATIPGYVFFEPSGSTADVQAEATFTAAGTWTVELRRLRNTSNSDDTVF